MIFPSILNERNCRKTIILSAAIAGNELANLHGLYRSLQVEPSTGYCVNGLGSWWLVQYVFNEFIMLIKYCLFFVKEYRDEPDWCSEAKDVVGSLPARNAHTLKCILRLLHLYNTRHSDKGYLQPLAAVFSPLLLCGEYHGIATPDTTYLTSKLISDYKYIFCDRLVLYFWDTQL